jgi:hypothetical protein
MHPANKHPYPGAAAKGLLCFWPAAQSAIHRKLWASEILENVGYELFREILGHPIKRRTFFLKERGDVYRDLIRLAKRKIIVLVQNLSRAILQGNSEVHGHEHRRRAACDGIKENSATRDVGHFSLKHKVGTIGFGHNPVLRAGDELVHHGLREDLLDSKLRRPIHERWHGKRVRSRGKRICPAGNVITAAARG